MPLDMPRAEAYLVREDGVSRLEDRFDRMDLWMTQAVIGRWSDEKDRLFLLSALDVCPPMIDRATVLTRAEYESRKVRMKRVRANADFPAAFRDAVTLLSPCPVLSKPRAPRQMPRGYKEVYYWQNPTKYSDIVCSFLPEKTNTWFLATWKLAEGDDYPTQMAAFEDQFLKTDFPSLVSRLKSHVLRQRTSDGRRETGNPFSRIDPRMQPSALRNRLLPRASTLRETRYSSSPAKMSRRCPSNSSDPASSRPPCSRAATAEAHGASTKPGTGTGA